MTPATGTLITSARNATPAELVTILQGQRARQLDIVLPSTSISLAGGVLRVADSAVAMGETGTTRAGGAYRPQDTFDSGLSAKLGIPLKWVRWMRENDPYLLDATVNDLLHGHPAFDATDAAFQWLADHPDESPANCPYTDDTPSYDARPPMPARHLLRLFTGDPGEPGIARAWLSDTYRPIDSLDVIMTALTVINDARATAIAEVLGKTPEALTDADWTLAKDMDLHGLAGGVELRNVQITEQSMTARFTCPGIISAAPELDRGYRPPFRDGGMSRLDSWQDSAHKRPREGDIVWAGFDVRNNEVGQGAFEIVPVVLKCVCDNGMVVPQQAIRQVHLGGRLDEGIIAWSAETQRKAMELVLSKTKDAMGKFLSQAGLDEMVGILGGRASVLIEDPAKTVEVIAKKHAFSDGQARDILRAFTLGGQVTAAGILNAVTAAAQVQAAPQDAIDLEYAALAAMETAADYALANPPTR